MVADFQTRQAAKAERAKVEVMARLHQTRQVLVWLSAEQEAIESLTRRYWPAGADAENEGAA